MMDTQLGKCSKNNWNVHFNVKFLVCKLYFDKVVRKQFFMLIIISIITV